MVSNTHFIRQVHNALARYAVLHPQPYSPDEPKAPGSPDVRWATTAVAIKVVEDTAMGKPSPVKRRKLVAGRKNSDTDPNREGSYYSTPEGRYVTG
jgi:hypothetical protein